MEQYADPRLQADAPTATETVIAAEMQVVPDPDLHPDMVRHLAAIRRLLGLLLLVLLVIGLYFSKEVILPLIMGTLMALTLSPVVRDLQRFGIAPPVTALVLVLGIGLVFAGGAFVMSGPVSSWVEDAPQLGAELQQKLRTLTSSVQAVQEASEQVEQLASEGTAPGIQKVAVQSPGLLSSAVSNAASILTTVLVTLVLALFILSSGDMFYIKLIDAFPKFGDKKRALKIVYGIERSVSRYLLLVTLINAGLGLSVGVAMWAIGMPQPVVWALIAFLFNYLPYAGTVAGVALVGAVAIVSFDSLTQAMLAPALFLLATTIESQFVTPVVLGRRLELNTVSVFVTVVFWGWLWGIAGALMAVPFLVCLKVICDNVESLNTLGTFLSSSREE